MIREALDVYMLANHGLLHSLLYRSLMALSAAVRIPALLAAWAVTPEGSPPGQTRPHPEMVDGVALVFWL